MRRSRILILVGLILACGTAAIIFLLLQNATKAPPGTEVKRKEVVVASQPVEDGDPVEGRLEIKSLPEEGLPEGALVSLQATTGMLARGPIAQGSIVQAANLQTKQEQMEEASLGQLVEVGYVAVALPISELSSVSYGIIADDRIDVLMTFTFFDIDPETQSKEPICPPVCTEGDSQSVAIVSQIPRRVSQVILQDVRVLGVGRWQYGTPTEEEQAAQQQQTKQGQQTVAQPPEYITIMLKAQDALVLKLAREHGASIDLAVRAKDDHQTWVTEQMNLEYLLGHYGFTVPNKLNYTMEQLPPATNP